MNLQRGSEGGEASAGFEGEGEREGVGAIEAGGGAGEEAGVEGEGLEGVGGGGEAAEEGVEVVGEGEVDGGEEGEGVGEGGGGEGEGGDVEEVEAEGRGGLEEVGGEEVGVELFEVGEGGAFFEAGFEVCHRRSKGGERVKFHGTLNFVFMEDHLHLNTPTFTSLTLTPQFVSLKVQQNLT